MPEYSTFLHSLSDKAPSEWSKSFNDWNFMSLRDDISNGKDYVLISMSSWLKLINALGGAPAIPIYQYFVERMENQ